MLPFVVRDCVTRALLDEGSSDVSLVTEAFVERIQCVKSATVSHSLAPFSGPAVVCDVAASFVFTLGGSRFPTSGLFWWSPRLLLAGLM